MNNTTAQPNAIVHLLLLISMLGNTMPAAALAAMPSSQQQPPVDEKQVEEGHPIDGRSLRAVEVQPPTAPLRTNIPLIFSGAAAAPVAKFGVDQVVGYAPLEVAFSNQSTGAESVHWDFGDGDTSTERNPQHTYINSGSYDVTLSVTNTLGSDLLTRSSYIIVNDPDIDFIIERWAGTAPFTATFASLITGTLGMTNSVAVEEFVWDFGDGTVEAVDGDLITTTHSYTEPGMYTVTLTAKTATTVASGQHLTTHKSNAVAIADSELLDVALMTPVGGRLSSSDGRVTLDFAPGALDEARYISISHMDLTEVVTNTVDGQPRLRLPPDGLPVHMIELVAHHPDNLAVTEVNFSAPVTLTYHYRQSAGSESIGDLIDEDSLRFELYNEQAQTFTPLPSNLTTTHSQLTTVLDHFSTYGVTGDQANWVTPSIDSASVQMSRGTNSYGYPIPLPVGPAGFAPQMALQYSSGTINGMIGSKNTDTGWVGAGWSLELGQIVGDDSITLNSLSGELQSGGDGYYYLQSDTSVRVGEVARNTPLTDGIVSISRDINYQASTKDGTTYTFGSLTGHDGTPIGSTLAGRWRIGGKCKQKNQVFKLAKVEDIHGNTLEIVYDEYPGTPKCALDGPAIIRESYPSQIRYTTNANAKDSHAEYLVDFETAAKGYDAYQDARMGDGRRKLEAIHINYVPTDGPAQLVRTIDLEYETTIGAKRNLLTSLQLIGTDGSRLPPMTFGYQYLEVAGMLPLGNISCGIDGDGNAIAGNPFCYHPVRRSAHNKPFLSRIDSGYGGQVTFEYQTETESGHNLYQVVKSKTVTDLILGNTLGLNYHYTNARHKWQRSRGRNLVLHFGRFYGFGQVDQEDPLGRWSRHRYNNQKDDILNGYELESWLYHGHPDVDGLVYSARSTRYATAQWPVPRNEGEDEEDELVRFVYAAEQHGHQCEGTTSGRNLAGCLFSRSTSTVDAWGNGIEQTVYAVNGSIFRQSRSGYFQHPNRWLFRPAWSETLDGAGTRIAMTRSVYDEQAPSTDNGLLIANSELTDLTSARAWAGDADYLDTTITYDAYGNPLSKTVFNGYGSAGALASVDARTSTSSYDPHGIFPRRVTNPLGHEVTSSFDYRYQQPTSVTDPNGATTSTTFDPFGRTLTVTLPSVNGCGEIPDFRAEYADTITDFTTTPFASDNRYYERAFQRIDDCGGAPE